MLFADLMRQSLDHSNGLNHRDGFPLLDYHRPVIQMDVGLTYATPTLVSLVDLGFVPTGGRIVTRIIRGLTFDLRTREMFRVEACPGSDRAYGAKGGNYLFQFGKLLQLCDTETYLSFVRLLTAKAALVAEQTAGSKNRLAASCGEKAGRVVAPHQEIVLYLTFGGLAVHNTEYEFIPRRDDRTLERSPVNPIILPYRELEPFMIPGAQDTSPDRSLRRTRVRRSRTKAWARCRTPRRALGHSRLDQWRLAGPGQRNHEGRK
jgi:hypothetical protein